MTPTRRELVFHRVIDELDIDDFKRWEQAGIITLIFAVAMIVLSILLGATWLFIWALFTYPTVMIGISSPFLVAGILWAVFYFLIGNQKNVKF